MFPLHTAVILLTSVLSLPSDATSQATTPRPEASGLTVFLYVQDIEKAVEFYRSVLGLPAVVDKGPIHVFQVTPNTSVGLVDSKTARGAANRPSVNKPVTVTFVVDDVDVWYRYLLDRGVTIARPPRDSSNLNVRFFIFNDPEGYELEVMSWRKPS